LNIETPRLLKVHGQKYHFSSAPESGPVTGRA